MRFSAPNSQIRTRTVLLAAVAAGVGACVGLSACGGGARAAAGDGRGGAALSTAPAPAPAPAAQTPASPTPAAAQPRQASASPSRTTPPPEQRAAQEPRPQPAPNPAPAAAAEAGVPVGDPEAWRPGWWIAGTDGSGGSAKQGEATVAAAMATEADVLGARRKAVDAAIARLERAIGRAALDVTTKIDTLQLPDGRYRTFILVSAPTP